MSARAGVSPRCSSSFYWGRRTPRCHNKTVATAKPAGETELRGGRREREREQPTPLQLSSSLDKCHFHWLPPSPSPCLPLLSHFCYDLIVSCLAPPPSCTRCFNSTHPSSPHPSVPSVDFSLLLVSHAAPIPAIAFPKQWERAGRQLQAWLLGHHVDKWCPSFTNLFVMFWILFMSAMDLSG